MRILIFETNLMWSARLVNAARALGHEPILRDRLPREAEGAQAAIVNLGESKVDPRALVEGLRRLGVKTIAHAGHKERELLELGRAAGADILATNSEITHKLANLLEQVEIPEVAPEPGFGTDIDPEAG